MFPKSRAFACLFVIWLACLSLSAAQERTLGQIDFPVSGKPRAVERFLEGVLWLHSFEYPEAREAFVRAREIDSEMVMAYWGEAMSWNHPVWHRVNLKEGRLALSRLGPDRASRLAKAATQRERDYLAAVEILFFAEGDKQARDDAYAVAMAELADRFPDDLEAASFHSLALLGTCNQGRHIPTYMKAAAVAEDVYSRNPRHPGALHYLIHSYDDPVHAPLGLRQARLYARTAPAAGHALHMPSHIFLALGMWPETVSSNIDSWSAGEQRVARRKLPPDERNYHALYWLEYGLLQQGRYREALGRLEVIRGDFKRRATPRNSAHLALMRAAVMIESRDWSMGFLSLTPTMDVGLNALVSDWFAQGFSALHRDRLDEARAALSHMREWRRRAENPKAGRDAEFQRPALRTEAAQVMEMELEAGILLQRGQTDQALALVAQAASMEEKIPAGFGPSVPVKPAHEWAGELTLKAGLPAKATEWFRRSLERHPGRALSLLGMARSASLAGRRDESLKAYGRLKEIWKGADADHPGKAEVEQKLSALSSTSGD